MYLIIFIHISNITKLKTELLCIGLKILDSFCCGSNNENVSFELIDQNLDKPCLLTHLAFDFLDH